MLVLAKEENHQTVHLLPLQGSCRVQPDQFHFYNQLHSPCKRRANIWYTTVVNLKCHQMFLQLCDTVTTAIWGTLHWFCYYVGGV